MICESNHREYAYSTVNASDCSQFSLILLGASLVLHGSHDLTSMRLHSFSPVYLEHAKMSEGGCTGSSTWLPFRDKMPVEQHKQYQNSLIDACRTVRFLFDITP